MLYELRIYHCMPGKLGPQVKRFENITLKLWEKHGIRQVGFWTSVISESNNDLYYILEWASLAEREQRWNAFMSDPEWTAVKAETEKDGAFTSHITNMILSPTSFSKIK